MRPLLFALASVSLLAPGIASADAGSLPVAVEPPSAPVAVPEPPIPVAAEPKPATLIVRTPAAAELYVDGAPRAARHLTLPAGEHVVEVRLAKHPTVRKRVQLAEGSSQELELGPPKNEGAARVRKALPPTLYTLAGLQLVGAGFAYAFASDLQSKASSLERTCARTGGCGALPGLESRTDAYVGGAATLMASAGIAALTGSLLGLHLEEEARAEERRVRIKVGSAGLGLSGSF